MADQTGIGTDELGELHSIQEQFDWQLDHGVKKPRFCAGLAGKNSTSGAYNSVTSTTVGGKELLDVNIAQDISNIGTDLDNYVVEDTSFVTGDSPVVLDLNANLGVNSTRGYLRIRGGSVGVELSDDGTTWNDRFTLFKGDTLDWTGRLSIDSIRLTWISNSAYYLNAYK